MEFQVKDNELTIFLSGRVDSFSTPETEKAVFELIAENPHDKLTLDAKSLEYISSAGLRMVLKLRKSDDTLSIVNTSAEVYDVFEMTGFTEMIPVQKAYRELSVDGCEIIGKGAKGTVYRFNPEIVVKVYNDPDSIGAIKRERELARKAFILGVPTAISYDIVTVDGKYGSVFELLNCNSFTQEIKEHPERLEELSGEMGNLLRKMHETLVKKEDMPDARARLGKYVKLVSEYISEADLEKVKALVDAIPETMNMIHGDYHSNNIMLQNGEAILIDMDTLSHGHPIIELANVYCAYKGFGELDHKVSETFIGLPYDAIGRVYQTFLKAYFYDRSEEEINAISERIELLGSMRVIRHFLHRPEQSQMSEQIIQYAAEKISRLLKTVDTLVF